MSPHEPGEVATRVLKGFRAADTQYMQTSGGWRLHTAPEYLATVKIGEQVAEPGRRYVTMEQNINDTVGWSGGARFQGKQQNLPASGRFDVAVWGPGSAGIVGVIEVKLGAWFTYTNVGMDVRRVCDALAQAPDLRWGMSAFHFACWQEVSKTGEERLRERMARIVQRARAHAQNKTRLTCTEFIGQESPVEDWNGLSGGCAAAAVLVFGREQPP